MSTTVSSKTEKTVTKPNYRYLRDKDREKVKGKFHFHEVPGGLLEFSFRKWKEDEVEKYSFNDGEIYTIPLGVAKHLNNDCWYPVHTFIMDEKNNQTQKISQKVRRCSFQSLEFLDIEDLHTDAKQIIMVENI